ncbi:MAG: phage distal tail protein [Eubacteriales bacterium]
MIPYITFTLDLGGRILTISKKSVFRLIKYDGIEATVVSVSVASNGSVDGGYLQSVRVEPRLISLTFAVDDRNRTEELRKWLIKYFTPKEQGTITVSRGNVTRIIHFIIAEKLEYKQNNIIEDKLIISVSLLCPDPYFYDITAGEVRFLTYTPIGTFPITSMFGVGVTTGFMTVTDTVEMVNDGDAPVGVVCEITAFGGSVTNPKIMCNGEYVRVLRVMDPNEVIQIDTRERRKNIYVDGEAQFIFDRTSVFFSLPVGINTLTVAADSGLTNASTVITYTLKYFGV